MSQRWCSTRFSDLENYAHNALYRVISAKSWIVSFPLTSRRGSSSTLIHNLFPCQSTSLSLSLMSLSPPAYTFPFLYSCFSCLCFLPPLKCRNPSTAFYQAFRPSRLRGSKPVNDRYELGCVYLCVCVWSLDWTGWLNQTLHPFNPAQLARKCPFWLVV